MIKIVYWSSCNVPVIVSDCNETGLFRQIFENVLPLGAELSREDGQTD